MKTQIFMRSQLRQLTVWMGAGIMGSLTLAFGEEGQRITQMTNVPAPVVFVDGVQVSGLQGLQPDSVAYKLAYAASFVPAKFQNGNVDSFTRWVAS